MGKVVTILYLISLMATLWMVFRHQLRLDNMEMLKKALVVLFSGYSLTIIFIYINTLQWEKPLLFLLIVSFCPFVWFLISILRRNGYKGDLSILMLTIMLNSIGIIILYRLDISSGWFLTRAAGYQENVSIAIKQLAYSAAALLGLVIGISKGSLHRRDRKDRREKKYSYMGYHGPYHPCPAEIIRLQYMDDRRQKPPAE